MAKGSIGALMEIDKDPYAPFATPEVSGCITNEPPNVQAIQIPFWEFWLLRFRLWRHAKWPPKPRKIGGSGLTTDDLPWNTKYL